MSKKSLRYLVIFIFFIGYFGLIGQQRKDQINTKHQVMLRLAFEDNEEYPIYAAVHHLVENLEKQSQGEFEIVTYSDGMLGNDASVIEQVQFGGIDLAYVRLNQLAKNINGLNVLLTPYKFTEDYDLYNYMQGEEGSIISENIEKNRIQPLAWYEGGQVGIFSTSEVTVGEEDEDMIQSALQLGVPSSQLLMDQLSNMGATPVPIEKEEIYNSLDNGFIQGIYEELSTYYIARHDRLAPYVYITNHQQDPYVLIASKLTMSQLTKKEQKWIMDAAISSIQPYLKEKKVKEKEALLFLEKGNKPWLVDEVRVDD